MQLKAIQSALEHKFQLIQGPPGNDIFCHKYIIIMKLIGTGKSVIGAHLAYIFAMSNRKAKKHQCVLYCGPSNKAVDVVHCKPVATLIIL